MEERMSKGIAVLDLIHHVGLTRRVKRLEEVVILAFPHNLKRWVAEFASQYRAHGEGLPCLLGEQVQSPGDDCLYCTWDSNRRTGHEIPAGIGRFYPFFLL